ncbi:helix-turn-helix domain-containing protein [Streptomyces sp. NPDC092129]|uniref:helix-turn-helix domain-containing protein n=1 Tax=Streptomyces sp. NPDC092129 TaxID=3366010 RepID=UPI0038246471
MDFEIRKDRRPQGPRKLDREREEYLRLVELGIGNTEACRIIGINRRTGRRWLYGRQASGRYKAAPPIVDTGLPWQAPELPARPEEPVGPSRYLPDADRIHIADPLREKASVRAIAAELGRSPSAHRKPGDPPQPHAHAQRRLVLPSPRRPAPHGRPQTAPQARQDR